MVRFVFLIVCLNFFKVDNVNCNERFEFIIHYLKITADVPPYNKIEDLKRYKIPLPLPNMFVGYMTPTESFDLFESYARTHWDYKKSLLENWVPIVNDFNKLHRSKPIPIPKQRSDYENDIDRVGKPNFD